MYCPAQKGIPDNETTDSLAKVASKKAKKLPQRTKILPAELSNANKHLRTLYKNDKGDGKIQNTTNINKVPQINSVGLKQRFLQLKHTSKRGSSKILQLKSGH